MSGRHEVVLAVDDRGELSGRARPGADLEVDVPAGELREIGSGVCRFDAIQQSTGAPREMLTARLRELESTGVITRNPYSRRPPRHEYALTAAGEELVPVMAALYDRGEKHATPTLAADGT